MIECAPAESPEVVKLAFPELNVVLPSVLAPSMNVIVPVGNVSLLENVPLAAAAKVTGWPGTDGLTELVRVIEGVSLLIVNEEGAEEPPRKLASPE